MKLYADLHIHSRYSRACSPELVPENLAIWAKRKGIGVLGTGDFTHPGWQEMLDKSLEEKTPGLYGLKNDLSDTLFLYQTEIASIYKQGDKVRRVHNLVFAPNRATALKISDKLTSLGCNLRSDGRPITGVRNEDLLALIKDIDEKCELVPAHLWTPHFGAFGSMSGFDSLEEGYGKMASYIWAVETGISSDPVMNRMVGSLDRVQLLSNSDPHSLRRIGRECNALEVDKQLLSYESIINALKDVKGGLLYTVEFFPEEGRYHLDGHKDCNFSCLPKQTRELKGMCPVCGKALLRGTLSRAEELGSKQEASVIKQFYKTLQLEEIIAETVGVGVQSKKVQSAYLSATDQAPELEILLHMPEQHLVQVLGQAVAFGVLKVRRGELSIDPGFDGCYGKVTLHSAPRDLFS